MAKSSSNLKSKVYVAIFVTLFGSGAVAGDWSGNIELQTRLYKEDGLLGQDKLQSSVAGAFEYVHSWDDSSIVFAPKFRVDDMDDERTDVDLTEFYFNHFTDTVEWRIGVKKVFWGVAESQHLVDIINQTDAVQAFDGEEKLGQPMVNASFERDWGIFDVYLLPYFRERTFPSIDGRLGVGLPVLDQALYESGAEEHHLDYALRYSHTLGDFDLGISFFDGTSRDPLFIPVMQNQQISALQSYYPQIKQLGLDLQATLGAWLWKLEMIQRNGFGEGYIAAVGGFEYSFYSLMDTDMDLGIIAEYQFDQRDVIEPLQIPVQDKLVLGSRLAWNDVQSTELLAVYVHEQQSDLGIFNLEFSRRIGNDWKLSVNASNFINQVDNIAETATYLVQNDSVLEINMAYYF